MNTVSLHGSTDVLDIDDVLDLLQVSRVAGCLRIEGPASGSLHVSGTAVLDVVVDGRPAAAELARRSAAVLAVGLADRIPRVLAGLLGELVADAGSFSFVSGGGAGGDPAPIDLLRLRKELAVLRTANRRGAGGVEPSTRLVRAERLPDASAAVSVDRLAWWVLGRCAVGATVEEIAVDGGLTADEVAAGAGALLDAGLLVVAEEPAWLDEPSIDAAPAVEAASAEAVEAAPAGEAEAVGDDHPGWRSLADAVLGLPPTVVDLDELRQLRILDPAARDSRRDRRRSRGVAVPT